MKLTRGNLIWWLWWLVWIAWHAFWPIFVAVAIGAISTQLLARPLGLPLALAPAGVLALLVLAVLVRNMLKIGVREHFIVRRPPDEVFRFIATNYFQNRPYWTGPGPYGSRLVELKQTSPGPVGIGTTGREVSERDGLKIVWTLEVTTYEPDRRFALELQTSGAHATTRYDFAPISGGTDVSLSHAIKYDRQARARIWAPIYNAISRRGIRANIRRLQQLMETAPAGPESTATPERW